MNALDQEITIAKVCGWTHTKTVHNPDPSAYGRHPVHTADVAWDLPLPDYLNDLNAMHEAEKVLSDYQHGLFRKLLFTLYYNSGGDSDRRTNDEAERWRVSATASQRAEAFLRAVHLWRDGE